MPSSTRHSYLLLQHSIVHASQARDGRASNQALPAAVHGAVDALDRGPRDPSAKGDALAVDDKAEDCFRDAESDWVNQVLLLVPRVGAGSAVARGESLHGCRGREVEEVAHEAGTNQGGEGPC